VPVAVAKRSYSASLAASGGIHPYVWSVASGSLPKGITLNSSTGRLSGATSAVGPHVLVIRVTSADDQSAKETLNLRVV
jgi:hypothetical protein